MIRKHQLLTAISATTKVSILVTQLNEYNSSRTIEAKQFQNVAQLFKNKDETLRMISILPLY